MLGEALTRLKVASFSAQETAADFFKCAVERIDSYWYVGDSCEIQANWMLLRHHKR